MHKSPFLEQIKRKQKYNKKDCAYIIQCSPIITTTTKK